MVGRLVSGWIREWSARLLIDPLPRYCPRCRREAAWHVAKTADDDAGAVACVCGRCGLRLVLATSLHP